MEYLKQVKSREEGSPRYGNATRGLTQVIFTNVRPNKSGSYLVEPLYILCGVDMPKVIPK